MKKGEKGVTVLSVAISVLIIIIITSVLAFSAKDSVYIKSLTNLNNDIELLREKISAHYSQYGEIPAKISYTIPSDWGGNEFIGANDVDENNIEGNGFYVIDLQAIDGLTLNYGEGYKEIDKTAESISGKVDDDLYIINKNSHNIFYVKGVNVPTNGTTKSYYTDEKNVDTIKVALQEAEGELSEYTAKDLAKRLSNANGKSVIGKTVEGLTGGACENYGWKIFYADNNNIYLIADNYITFEDAPYKTENRKVKVVDENKPRSLFIDLVTLDYPNTLNDISVENNLLEELKSLNDEFKEFKTNEMQAVSYMLDSGIWKTKFVGENNKVKYVIGGPTIKQFFNSYNAKYGTTFEAGINEKGPYGYGYRMSEDDEYVELLKEVLNTEDSTYVIDSEEYAYGMWISSPNWGVGNLNSPSSLCVVLKDGGIEDNLLQYMAFLRPPLTGFRPLICLDSSVKLAPTESGFKIME